ncbi:MAG: NUDIX domain-containing protein [Peptococcaceae bacterium]|nr:NUDIX domain-containing protein [Peptococcaceae bacterium]
MAEYWDLVDEARQPTGETLRRGDEMPAGRYHTVIGVWTIHRHLGRILVTKRSPEKSVCPNVWENTGGSILAGETSAEGAAREVREETGMDCHTADLAHIQTLRIPTAFIDCYIYLTDINPDAIVLQPGETVDWRWVTQAELEALIEDGTFAPPEIEQYNVCRDDLAAALAALAD